MRCNAAALAVVLALPGAAAAAAPLDELGSHQGQVVYVDFWASWCTPCRQAFPWLQAMHESYALRGLSIVAVDVDANRADGERFLKRFHPGFEVRFDPSGSLARQFKLEGMPCSVLIDRRGNVRFTHIGFSDKDRITYERQLRELLDEP
ncbi:MAG TPA: TlpA disulfide reductase family protein [Steroidobacteraceae bacterium]|nr:TlpA disulfide reductase family protein [Steroidobacteraceae bacterium]